MWRRNADTRVREVVTINEGLAVVVVVVVLYFTISKHTFIPLLVYTRARYATAWRNVKHW